MKDCTCHHPLFRCVLPGRWNEAPENLSNPHVFVFDRSRYLTPTDEQVQKYRDAKHVVEQLGGSMNQQEWQIAGVAPVLSPTDIADILEAVKRDNPEATIIDHWNGEGSYTMSVGVDLGMLAKLRSIEK